MGEALNGSTGGRAPHCHTHMVKLPVLDVDVGDGIEKSWAALVVSREQAWALNATVSITIDEKQLSVDAELVRLNGAKNWGLLQKTGGSWKHPPILLSGHLLFHVYLVSAVFRSSPYWGAPFVCYTHSRGCNQGYIIC